jgi:hypothetical protein
VEGIVNGSKEGANYHKGNARIVQTPEEKVEAFGVTSKEVREGAAD